MWTVGGVHALNSLPLLLLLSVSLVDTIVLFLFFFRFALSTFILFYFSNGESLIHQQLVSLLSGHFWGIFVSIKLT